MTDKSLWTTKYKPTHLNEIVSCDTHIKVLKNLLGRGNIPHLIFYGNSGVGKTSTIQCCINEIYGKNIKSMVLELNASDERGIEVIREKIATFASTITLFSSSVKLIILEEADLMTADAQNALKKIIEIYVANCKFCILCNNINKIIPEIQSRCIKFRFSQIKYNNALEYIKNICVCENITISDKALDIIIRNGNGDLRKMVNMLQTVYNISYKKSNNINESHIYKILNIITIKDIKVLLTNFKEKNFMKTFKLLEEYIHKYNYSIIDIINIIYEHINEFDNLNIENTLIALAELEVQTEVGVPVNIVIGTLISIIIH